MTVYIGLMSGTSMDGVDAALIDVESHRLIGGIMRPYDSDIREQLLALGPRALVTPEALWQLHTRVGQQFAQAALELLESVSYSGEVRAIGSHGQTIAHDVTSSIPYTLQLGCPHTISTLTGKTVVADFRTRDVVNGGTGAPFAPIYHHALLGAHQRLALVNIGGIANITILNDRDGTFGYDVGPGNCLLDAWIGQQKGLKYDDNGLYASQGSVIPTLLKALQADDYFKLPYPKSICKSYFSLAWLRSKLQADYTPEDVQATLLALTATTIASAIHRSIQPIRQLALCGGGAHNGALLQALQHHLPNTKIVSTKALGIDVDYLEAMMFGWLAHQALTCTKLDLTQITGANKPAILGAIYPI